MAARQSFSVCALCTVTLFTACSSNPPRSTPVSTAPIGYENSQVRYGQVASIERVSMAARSSGGGAVLGAVLGAVIGNQIGSGGGRAVATGVGAVGGAAIGDQVEKNRRGNEADVYRVGVRFEDGGYAQFDYQRVDYLRVGDRVKVESGQIHML